MIKSKIKKHRANFIILVLIVLSATAFIQAQRGSLDLTFGSGGKVITDFGNGALNDWGRAGAIQSDGKIIEVGEIVLNNSGNSAFGVARYNSNGTLDTTFGSGGKALADFSANFDFPTSVAIQSDGKIVVAGISSFINNTTDSNRAVVRFNSNGTVDTAFGTNGRTTLGIGLPGEYGTDVAIQSNGTIIVAGTSKFAQSGNAYNISIISGNGGVMQNFQTLFPGETNVYADTVVIQADDKFVVAGASGDASGGKVTLARYTSSGALDISFDGDGRVSSVVGTNVGIFASAIQTDGKILVAGIALIPTNNAVFVAGRYNTDGSLDVSFDGDGFATMDFATNSYDAATGVSVRNGKITLTGSTASVTSGAFAIVQFNDDGSPDLNFGNGGKVITDFSNSADISFDSAIQPDGKLVMFGRTTGQAIDFALARYNLVGASRNNFDFDGDGKADIGVARPDTFATNWYINRSTLGFIGVQFGLPSDRLAPADYDGDGRTDIAVNRSGNWYLLQSRDGFKSVAFGSPSDALAPGDYDGDGKADVAVVRPEVGTGSLSWYIQQSSNGQFRAIQFGSNGDKLVQADYDGDSRTDVAVYRGGYWYVQRSTRGFTSVQFGLPTDTPIVGDFNANGTADFTVFRNGIWYVLEGANQIDFLAYAFGQENDIPVAADYDGDGKTDTAVFRNGVWYLNRSTAGFAAATFGTIADRPIPNIFVP